MSVILPVVIIILIAWCCLTHVLSCLYSIIGRTFNSLLNLSSCIWPFLWQVMMMTVLQVHKMIFFMNYSVRIKEGNV